MMLFPLLQFIEDISTIYSPDTQPDHTDHYEALHCTHSNSQTDKTVGIFKRLSFPTKKQSTCSHFNLNRNEQKYATLHVTVSRITFQKYLFNHNVFMFGAFPLSILLLNDRSHISAERNFQQQVPKHILKQLQLMLAIKEFVFSNNQTDWVIFQEMVGEVCQQLL